MNNTVIKIENLSKQYRLGNIGTGTITHDINRWFYRIRGKEDPYLKIGDENDRSLKGSSEYVWALKDINFDVQGGELIGIIGSNGAGKSTLLKILSNTTTPTTGTVKIKNRVASLLEIGTGFHPELTGRQNIFLNGAILGMTKKEIKRKFDEIVEFSGVNRYIETPVKRYSSGMYVRLAFAVAAHLESEILIVDEVLAVGDAEFQKKCLSKMGEVSKGEGRTVLFVSHNLTAVNTLCNKCVYLKNGKLVDYGITKNVIQHYLSAETQTISEKRWDNNTNDGVAYILNARLINRNNQRIESAQLNEEIGIECIYEVKEIGYKPVPNFHLFNMNGDHIFVDHEALDERFSKAGIYRSIMWIPGNLLNEGRYTVGIAVSTHIPEKIHFYEQQALIFDVLEDMYMRDIDYRGKMPGVIRPKLEWQTSKID